MIDPHSWVFPEKAGLWGRQFVWRAPVGIAETLGSINRLRVADELDWASSKPMVEGSDRQHLVLGVVIGEQQYGQAPCTLWPRNLQPPDQGTRRSFTVLII